MRSPVELALSIIGLGLVFLGVYLVYPPAFIILCGLWLIAVGNPSGSKG